MARSHYSGSRQTVDVAVASPHGTAAASSVGATRLTAGDWPARVVNRVVSTLHKSKQMPVPYGYYGSSLRLARRNARGIAGLRADLRDGRITLRELALMSAADIGWRYKVKRGSARYMKRAILDYGGGSRCRDAAGNPRTKPLGG